MPYSKTTYYILWSNTLILPILPKYHIGQSLMREKFDKNVKNQFGKLKFGENIRILMIVVELQNVW